MSSTTFNDTLSNLGIKTPATSGTKSNPNLGKTTLDQSDFLKLMTAQLNNQDPFEPVDNTQMVAQMAQFSQVAGISSMDSTLQAIAAKLNATTASDALSYVGRTVLTPGTTAYPRTAGGIAGAVELDGAATSVKVSITDANGSVLKSLDLGAQSAGTVNYDWDGKTDAGTAAGDGPYKVSIVAQKDGAAVTSRSLVWAPVESVSAPASGSPVLSVTGLGSVNISDVRQIG
ncbi:flagellar hook assembly protein FlgD [Sphingomonas aracearum]|uniref:Basal-body rod modification protein FlgD n=1 Tax=Sphingomonas aracearum TaxID=2283317 RepID=A0A369VXK1_9SPHN|nr:flagellar hook assembly protein FlgD [Sphingomonas aracearum]RDE05880.1 flagellar hook assembly protein FlgD [Sphingomonas aracearum]